MSNEGRGMALASVIKQPKDGITRDARDETNVVKGIVVPTSNVDGRPDSKDENHGSKATSMIGQGSEPLSGTYEKLVKSVPTSELFTPSTRLTLRRPLILWI